jgi:outer membrane protein assembly factor BamD (BamD/ComL family)
VHDNRPGGAGEKTPDPFFRVRAIFRWTAFGIAFAVAGCLSPPKKPRDAVKQPSGEITQANHSDTPGSPVQHEGLNKAEQVYKQGEFEKSEELFAEIADDTKNRPEVAERARFYQAEALRRQGYYPKAVDTYHKLLQDFPAGLYREQAVGQMYLIASEWLQPVREEIENKGKPAGDRKSKSWTDNVIPVNFDRKLPTVATEERALKTLENVYFSDPTGPYADKALFMLGRVHFERQDFKESARFFQQLAETYDRSPLRDEALKLAIIAKTNSSGGAAYDGKDMAEAMRLINSAKATSPVVAREQEGKFLDQQALMVRYQQAQKDFETAEFYRRTGHPGSAWFYYELVLRRYPGIQPFAADAAARQKELKVELDETQNPTTMSTTRRFWKQYVLGHEIPTVKDPMAAPNLKDLPKELPEPRSATMPAGGAVPSDGRPR